MGDVYKTTEKLKEGDTSDEENNDQHKQNNTTYPFYNCTIIIPILEPVVTDFVTIEIKANLYGGDDPIIAKYHLSQWHLINPDNKNFYCNPFWINLYGQP